MIKNRVKRFMNYSKEDKVAYFSIVSIIFCFIFYVLENYFMTNNLIIFISYLFFVATTTMLVTWIVLYELKVRLIKYIINPIKKFFEDDQSKDH